MEGADLEQSLLTGRDSRARNKGAASLQGTGEVVGGVGMLTSHFSP